MYIQRNTYKAHSGKEYKTTLLSEKYRENGKIKTRTVQNLSNLPEEVILSIENTLAELTKIKICELKIGQNINTLKIPKLNDIQKQLFEILKLTPSQMLLHAK